MNSKYLSIIIPLYNVELYVKKCLMSCILQNIVLGKEYEIICVNDGTKDKSAEIAKEISLRYNGVVVIDQENGGLSVARNTGLSHAKGEYVWFVDSDDWIEHNCLSNIVDCLNNTKPDFLQLQFRYAYDDNSRNRDSYSIIDNVITGIQQINNGGVPIPAQFAIYRRDFLIKNNLKFYPGIYHEDCEFKPKVLYLAERCASYDQVVYNYYQRTNGSITTIINPKRAFDYLKVAVSIDKFYCNKTKIDCTSYFHNHISLMINNALSVVGDKEKEFSIELYSQRHLFVHLKQSKYLKYRIEGLLFSVFPKQSVFIYKLLRLLVSRK